MNIGFLAVRPRRLSDDVCRQIRASIASGELVPGDRLPNERDLAAQFGISRTAVREALNNLEMVGLLARKKGVNGGTYILGEEVGLLHSLSSQLRVRGISIEELTEARLHHETLMARISTIRATESDFQAISENIAMTRAAVEDPKLFNDPVFTQDFYRLIAVATGNAVFTMMTTSLSQLMFDFLRNVGIGPPPEGMVAGREAILMAMRARDGHRAAMLMEEHLRRLHDHIIANKQSEGDQRARKVRR